MITNRARSYVRARAIQQMSYVVRAERVLTKPSYDEEDLVATPGTREELYTGIARIWEISGASTINVGESDVDISSTQLSLPWSTQLLRKNDEVEVLSSMSDSAMVGKRFQIQSSAKAGELRATRRYNVTAVN